MKRYLIKTSFYALPIFLLLVGVNYIGDAAKLFHSDFEKNMVSILNNGQYVTNIVNYDERVFQRELIDNMREAPKVVVLGSSRLMQITEEFLGVETMNNCVSGATIEDLIAIYQMYKSKGLIPSTFIIGMDPWIFNINNNQSRWLSIKNEYEEYLDGGSSAKHGFELLRKYEQLLSLSYFQASVKVLDKAFKGNDLPFGTDNINNISSTKLIDGSIVYGEVIRNSTDEQISQRVESYISEKIYGLEGFEELSPKTISMLKRLLMEIDDSESELILVMPPYHPRVYDKLIKDYPYVERAEHFIRVMAQELNVKVYGSYDPIILGLDETDFFDGMHSRKSAIESVMRLNKN